METQTEHTTTEKKKTDKKSEAPDPKLVEAIADAVYNRLHNMFPGKVSKENIHAALKGIPEDDLNEILRTAGLTPEVKLWHWLTPWHEVEHFRAAGFNNKMQGAKGILGQIAIGILAYLAGDKYVWGNS